jgi:hypothetical protein
MSVHSTDKLINLDFGKFFDNIDEEMDFSLFDAIHHHRLRHDELLEFSLKIDKLLLAFFLG